MERQVSARPVQACTCHSSSPDTPYSTPSCSKCVGVGTSRSWEFAHYQPRSQSKPAISRPYSSTLIPRGIYRDRQRPDKPITHPSQRNKPEILPRQKEHLDKKFL